jgi:GT2 family glycosyltransferase
MCARVCAVVVTYNRKDLLRICLQAVHQQTRPVDAILVVDNASTDGTAGMIAAEFPDLQYLRLADNLGGAGGFNAGMWRACQDGHDWIWIMDDDCRPAEDCLELLLNEDDGPSVRIPLMRDSTGFRTDPGVWAGRVTSIPCGDETLPVGHYLFTFVGPLLPRDAILQAGLPRSEFFIWFDDVEYALRLRRLGIPSIIIPRATMYHEFYERKTVRFLGGEKIRGTLQPWKVYYGARNGFYTITRYPPDRRALWLFLHDQTRAMVGDLLFEDQRWAFLHARLSGLLDGFYGRLGKRR